MAGSAAESGRAPSDTGMLHSVRAYPAFAMLLLGTMATNSAYWMYLTAIGWLALKMTGSASFVGLAGFAGGIPMLVLGLPAGVILDRTDRRRVLMLAQYGVMVVAALFAVMEAVGALRPWSLLGLAFLYGSAMSFIFPTRTTIVPSLVARADIANAVALNSAIQNATRVVGPALAGVLIALISASGTFALAALLQVIAVFSTNRLPEAAAGTARSARRPGGILAGIQAISEKPALVGLVLLSLATNILVMPYINLMPVFVDDVLGLGSAALGILLASTGLGTVAGALAIARSSRLARQRGIQVTTVLAFMAFVLLFTGARHIALAIPILFAAGFMCAIFMAVNQTTLQLNVEDERRGRVMSIYLLTWGMLPLGQLGVGLLADHLGAPRAMAVFCVVAMVAVVAIGVRLPVLLRGDGSERADRTDAAALPATEARE